MGGRLWTPLKRGAGGKMVKNHGTKLNVEISEKLEKISKNSKQILNKEKKSFKNVD